MASAQSCPMLYQPRGVRSRPRAATFPRCGNGIICGRTGAEVPLVGEVEMTAHDYRALVALRASYIPFYCKVLGIVLAVAGLLSLSWSEGYAIPGVLILAGVLV